MIHPPNKRQLQLGGNESKKLHTDTVPTFKKWVWLRSPPTTPTPFPSGIHPHEPPSSRSDHPPSPDLDLGLNLSAYQTPTVEDISSQ